MTPALKFRALTGAPRALSVAKGPVQSSAPPVP